MAYMCAEQGVAQFWKASTTISNQFWLQPCRRYRVGLKF